MGPHDHILGTRVPQAQGHQALAGKPLGAADPGGGPCLQFRQLWAPEAECLSEGGPAPHLDPPCQAAPTPPRMQTAGSLLRVEATGLHSSGWWRAGCTRQVRVRHRSQGPGGQDSRGPPSPAPLPHQPLNLASWKRLFLGRPGGCPALTPASQSVLVKRPGCLWPWLDKSP